MKTKLLICTIALMFGCAKHKTSQQPNEEVVLVIDSATNLLKIIAPAGSGTDTSRQSRLTTNSELKKSIFFVETPGGVQKVSARDSLFALASIGATVWPESEWNELVKKHPHFGLDVIDRTCNWKDDYVAVTNTDGFVFFEDPRPTPKELVVISNVLALKFQSTLIPLLGMTDEQIVSVTNAFPLRVIRLNRFVITTRDIQFIGSQEVD